MKFTGSDGADRNCAETAISEACGRQRLEAAASTVQTVRLAE